jgi:hypothetical protein
MMEISTIHGHESGVSYQQLNQGGAGKEPSAADRAKIEEAAKKAGVTLKPGQKPSDADLEKLRKAGGGLDIKV